MDMPFAMMTQVGRRYHVLDGGPDPLRGRGNFLGGDVAAQCKVMGHSTVSCAKMAEPIDMPFEERNWGPRNHVLDGDRSLNGKGQFSGVGVVWAIK